MILLAMSLGLAFPRPQKMILVQGGERAMQVIGYLRVSTEEQATSGLGLDAQRAAIQGEADRRGWTVSWVEDAGYSAKTMRRPGMRQALRALRRGEGRALVVSKLDRLSRSVQDFATTMETAQRQGWAVVALDLGVDTTTPAGELVANVMAAVAQWERRVIGQRTREGLAAAKARGVRLGRQRMTQADVVERILLQRSGGESFAAIAASLDSDAVPTPNRGRRWYPSTVSRLVASVERQQGVA
jgi:DNA invertase Pin-like site-specific DNA recombinase